MLTRQQLDSRSFGGHVLHNELRKIARKGVETRHCDLIAMGPTDLQLIHRVLSDAARLLPLIGPKKFISKIIP